MAACLLAGGCVTAPPRADAHRHGGTTSVAKSTQTTSTTTTTSTMPDRLPADLDPHDLAATVSLEASDVGGGASAVTDGHDVAPADDGCRPISNSPFKANLGSPTIADGESSDYWYSSQVAVEPSTHVATSVVARMSTNDWAQHCDLPQRTADLQQNLDKENADTPCEFGITSTSEKPIDASTLPPDVTGWRYQANVHCNVTGDDETSTVDTLITQVGPVVILLVIQSADSTPTDIEFHVISTLADRATSALSH